MNMIANPQPLIVSTAYRQLQAVERDFVDRYIAEIERRAEIAGEALRVFGKTIPADLYEKSRGLLDRQIVRAAIMERITEINEQSDLTPMRVLKELQCIAFTNADDFTTVIDGPSGVTERVQDMSKVNPDMMRAVSGWDVEEQSRGGRKMKLRFHDKLKALALLITHMGMNEPSNAYWQAQEAKRHIADRRLTTIDADASEQQATDAYQTYLESNS